MNHKYALVQIVWDDAASGAGWFESDKIKLQAQPVVTVGFVVKEDARYIVIGHSYCPDSSDCIGEFQIPKQMIVSRKTLIRAKRKE